MKTKHSTPHELVTVTSVEVVHHHVVLLTFSDGCTGELDLAPDLWGPVFEPVANDYEFFRQARVDLGTIVWPNGADLAPEVLHAKAAPACNRTGKR